MDTLPVVSTHAPDRLDGLLNRQDLMAAYERALSAESTARQDVAARAALSEA
ncbi:MAG TPA: hypothetical protein VEU55_01030 [Gemmatimonadales bacterium]|nr:hypothetical protein [Gemmatimonadales bacterium]